MTRTWNPARRWIAPVAALALLAGLGTAATRAADDTTPAGKAKITVKVVDGDGKAVEGATVGLYPPRARGGAGGGPGGGVTGGKAANPTSADPATMPTDPPTPGGGRQQRPKPLQSAKTDAEGMASFTAVADGTYSVQARMKGGGNGRANVTVADGKDESVTVTLKPRGG